MLILKLNLKHAKNYTEIICDVLRDLVPFGKNLVKNMKSTHRRVLLLVKLQALASNFSKRSTSPWVFFTFLKL